MRTAFFYLVKNKKSRSFAAALRCREKHNVAGSEKTEREIQVNTPLNLETYN